MDEREERHISAEIIVRRLYRRMRRIEKLYREVEALHDLVPVPTPEEFEEIVRGTKPLTLEVLLLGVLDRTMFHLSEARNAIDRYRPYSPSSLGKGVQQFWYQNLGAAIEHEVRFRAKGPPPVEMPRRK